MRSHSSSGTSNSNNNAEHQESRSLPNLLGASEDNKPGPLDTYLERLAVINKDTNYNLSQMPIPQILGDSVECLIMNKPVVIHPNGTRIDYDKLGTYKDNKGKYINPYTTTEMILLPDDFDLEKEKLTLQAYQLLAEKSSITIEEKTKLKTLIKVHDDHIKIFNLQTELRKQTAVFVEAQEKIYGLTKRIQTLEAAYQLNAASLAGSKSIDIIAKILDQGEKLQDEIACLKLDLKSEIHNFLMDTACYIYKYEEDQTQKNIDVRELVQKIRPVVTHLREEIDKYFSQNNPNLVNSSSQNPDAAKIELATIIQAEEDIFEDALPQKNKKSPKEGKQEKSVEPLTQPTEPNTSALNQAGYRLTSTSKKYLSKLFTFNANPQVLTQVKAQAYMPKGLGLFSPALPLEKPKVEHPTNVPSRSISIID